VSERFYLFNFMHGLGMVSRQSQHGGKQIEKKRRKNARLFYNLSQSKTLIKL